MELEAEIKAASARSQGKVNVEIVHGLVTIHTSEIQKLLDVQRENIAADIERQKQNVVGEFAADGLQHMADWIRSGLSYEEYLTSIYKGLNFSADLIEAPQTVSDSSGPSARPSQP